MANVVAFEYDNATTGSDAPVSFAVIPGLWTPGEAVLPGAFGMSVEQMRTAIKDYNLPLREVKVAEKDAVSEPDRGLNHLPVEDTLLRMPPKPSAAATETDAGPIPAPAPAGVHRPLLPLAAAMQAKNTVLANGGTLEEAAAAAREAGGEHGEGIAEVLDAAALDYARAAEAAAEDEAAQEAGTAPTGAGNAADNAGGDD